MNILMEIYPPYSTYLIYMRASYFVSQLFSSGTLIFLSYQYILELIQSNSSSKKILDMMVLQYLWG